MLFEINNKSGVRIQWVSIKRTLLRVQKIVPRLRNKKISIAFVKSREMRKLNRVYRHKNRSTTVLSFGAAEAIAVPHEDKRYIGELVLCPVDVAIYARKQHLGFQDALNILLVHGILHLVGYGHRTEREARKMESLQRRIGGSHQ